jgi:hypothetical protein
MSSGLSKSPEKSSTAAQLRRRIRTCLTIGLSLFLVLIVSAALFLILRNASDDVAAGAIRAIIYVAGTLFVLDAIVLISLMAHALLALLDQNGRQRQKSD